MAKYKPFDTTKRILITGAAGFIGFHLAKRLLEQGSIICGLDNINDYYDVSLKESRLALLKNFANFTFVKGNIADEVVVAHVFETFKPDIVVNLDRKSVV